MFVEMLGSALEDCLVLKSKRRESKFGQKFISAIRFFLRFQVQDISWQKGKCYIRAPNMYE